MSRGTLRAPLTLLLAAPARTPALQGSRRVRGRRAWPWAIKSVSANLNLNALKSSYNRMYLCRYNRMYCSIFAHV